MRTSFSTVMVTSLANGGLTPAALAGDAPMKRIDPTTRLATPGIRPRIVCSHESTFTHIGRTTGRLSNVRCRYQLRGTAGFRHWASGIIADFVQKGRLGGGAGGEEGDFGALVTR